MSDISHKRIHDALDGEGAGPALTPAEESEVARFRAVMTRLEASRVTAPRGLAGAVSDALDEERSRSALSWVAERLRWQQWGVPALAGALAMLLVMLTVQYWPRAGRPPTMSVHFELHAPGAQRVELLGNFNNWTPGQLRLRGPDASGHWTADVELPEGHYEYQFLVNGQTWVTDPNAAMRRPDGFGRENAVVEVYEERGI